MSRRDCICGARHRKDCVCQESLPGEREPRQPDAISSADQAAAEAIVNDQQQPGQREAFDRVFAMSSEQLGQAAVDGATREANMALSGSELEFIAKRDFARASDATLQADHRKSCLCGTDLYCHVHDAVVGE